MPDCLLAIDQGTHASRAVVFDLKGRPLASRVVPLKTLCPAPGWVEQDPEDIFETSVLQTIQKSFRRKYYKVSGRFESTPISPKTTRPQAADIRSFQPKHSTWLEQFVQPPK